MNPEDDDFLKPKPLKLNRQQDAEAFKKVDDLADAAPAVQHFKPTVRESPYSARNLLSLLIPIAVTAALGFGCYKGVMAFRDISARADAADREATLADAAVMNMKQDTARLENESSNIDQALPQLTERLRLEARGKAEAKYREELAALTLKIETTKQEHLAEAVKKQADAETIATAKVNAARAEAERAGKEAAKLEKESEELKSFLRANKRTMRPDV